MSFFVLRRKMPHHNVILSTPTKVGDEESQLKHRKNEILHGACPEQSEWVQNDPLDFPDVHQGQNDKIGCDTVTKQTMIKKFTTRVLAKKIAVLLSEKKGENIVILDVSKISSFCDFFIIVTGLVDTHIEALYEHIRLSLKKNYQITPLHIEGEMYNKWVILDYGNVIVHIMTPELREFYALEHIWSKGKKVVYEKKHKKSRK